MDVKEWDNFQNIALASVGGTENVNRIQKGVNRISNPDMSGEVAPLDFTDLVPFIPELSILGSVSVMSVRGGEKLLIEGAEKAVVSGTEKAVVKGAARADTNKIISFVHKFLESKKIDHDIVTTYGKQSERILTNMVKTGQYGDMEEAAYRSIYNGLVKGGYSLSSAEQIARAEAAKILTPGSENIVAATTKASTLPEVAKKTGDFKGILDWATSWKGKTNLGKIETVGFWLYPWIGPLYNSFVRGVITDKQAGLSMVQAQYSNGQLDDAQFEKAVKELDFSPDVHDNIIKNSKTARNNVDLANYEGKAVLGYDKPDYMDRIEYAAEVNKSQKAALEAAATMPAKRQEQRTAVGQATENIGRAAGDRFYGVSNMAEAGNAGISPTEWRQWQDTVASAPNLYGPTGIPTPEEQQYIDKKYQESIPPVKPATTELTKTPPTYNPAPYAFDPKTQGYIPGTALTREPPTMTNAPEIDNEAARKAEIERLKNLSLKKGAK